MNKLFMSGSGKGHAGSEGCREDDVLGHKAGKPGGRRTVSQHQSLRETVAWPALQGSTWVI